MNQNIEANSSPDLMTEQELIKYLRISEISESNNFHRVV
jgi:hypothetical protein